MSALDATQDDHDDNIRDGGWLDGRVLARSISSIVKPDGESE